MYACAIYPCGSVYVCMYGDMREIGAGHESPVCNDLFMLIIGRESFPDIHTHTQRAQTSATHTHTPAVIISTCRIYTPLPQAVATICNKLTCRTFLYTVSVTKMLLQTLGIK